MPSSVRLIRAIESVDPFGNFCGSSICVFFAASVCDLPRSSVHTKTLYSPHLEGLSDFIDVLHRRPLPPDLEDPKNFKDPSLNDAE